METLNIRPAARHILTIGRDLIKDDFSAIIELVKNSYDADASKVEISFLSCEDNCYKILINDDGHGMSFKDIKEKWLIPSTMNKKNTRLSKKHRRKIQGNKGIGRYAASILGDIFAMTTIDSETCEKTEVSIDWNDFSGDKYEFLDQVPININTKTLQSCQSGTFICIKAGERKTKKEEEEFHQKLISELNKLILTNDYQNEYDFIIEVSFFGEISIINPIVNPIYYHYRIKGEVFNFNNKKMKLKAVFENQNAESHNKNIDIEKEIDINADFGSISFDIKVCDLDHESKKRLLNDNINYFEEWKRYYGISLFRSGFRIRPYGDTNFDWLELNKRRFNNPTKCVSDKQVLGIVTIEDDNSSFFLEEKSSREGLKDNTAYDGLKSALISVISELENFRFSFKHEKKETFLLENKEEGLKNLMAFLDKNLDKFGVSNENSKKILDFVKKTEKDITKKTDNIVAANTEKYENIISSFENFTTIGKIITVILHDTINSIYAIKMNANNISSNFINKIVDRHKSISLFIDDVIKENCNKSVIAAQAILKKANIMNELYAKLNPLAYTKPPKKKNIAIKNIFLDIQSIYESKLKDIQFILNCEEDISVHIIESDILCIFQNIIENAIFWVEKANTANKEIKIEVVKENYNIYIKIYNNGEVLTEDEINKKLIFEWGYTTKPEGSGLGLSIANNAVKRNNGEIKAIYSPIGALFEVVFHLKNKNKNG